MSFMPIGHDALFIRPEITGEIGINRTRRRFG
jgi:hypothetical protein